MYLQDKDTQEIVSKDILGPSNIKTPKRLCYLMQYLIGL